MFDQYGFLGVPDGTAGDVKTYVGNLTTSNNVLYPTEGTWRVWVKPRGKSMVSFWCLGGGGGGGAGCDAFSNISCGGGGGGGTGGLVVAMLPSFMVPDTLYIQPGRGGLGGTVTGQASLNGGPGRVSYISMGSIPDGASDSIINSTNLFISSSATSYNYGGVGNQYAGGLAGIAPAISNITGSLMSGYHGWWFAFVGLVGYVGGYGAANGTACANTLTTIPCSGGAGGAGLSMGAQPVVGQAGGAVTLNIGRWSAATLPGGIAGTASADAGNGSSGMTLQNPFMSCGGGGGGSSFTSGYSGGNGGNGGIGSGGGGGGAGLVTPGNGGNGGPGIVIITTW